MITDIKLLTKEELKEISLKDIDFCQKFIDTNINNIKG